MRNPRSFGSSNVRLVAALAACLSFAAPGAASDERLPESWYRAGGKECLAGETTGRDETERERAAEGVIDRLIRANAAVPEGLDDTATRRGDWRLESFSVGLGVSAQGLLGALVARGDASAGLTWIRRGAAPRAEPPAETALVVIGDEDDVAIAARLEPVARALVAAGAVDDGGALRANLHAAAKRYQRLLAGMAPGGDDRWAVSRLRLDFAVDVSGTLSPALSAGGGIRMSFQWCPPKARPRRPPVDDDEARRLSRFLRALAGAVESVPLDDLAPTGFALTTVTFGLGISASGAFGVASASGSVTGLVSLSRAVPSVSGGVRRAPAMDVVPLVGGASAEALACARSHAIPFRASRGDAVFEIPADRFRRGLAKAVRIASVFARRAAKAKQARWELHWLGAGFSLSVSGGVGLVTVGGSASIDLTLERIGA